MGRVSGCFRPDAIKMGHLGHNSSLCDSALGGVGNWAVLECVSTRRIGRIADRGSRTGSVLCGTSLIFRW